MGERKREGGGRDGKEAGGGRMEGGKEGGGGGKEAGGGRREGGKEAGEGGGREGKEAGEGGGREGKERPCECAVCQQCTEPRTLVSSSMQYTGELRQHELLDTSCKGHSSTNK